MAALGAAALAEVRDLHAFFVGWLGGTLPRTEAAFARFADVIAEGFVIVSPRGIATARDDLARELEAAHGARAGADPPFTIRVENARVLRTWDERALVTYQEWQDEPAGTTARLASALFGRRDAAPHGVEWLHLHETWIESHAPGG